MGALLCTQRPIYARIDLISKSSYLSSSILPALELGVASLQLALKMQQALLPRKFAKPSTNPRVQARAKPEKIRKVDTPVTFDNILKRNPNKQMKFSRLINHDIDRRWQRMSDADYFYGHDISSRPYHNNYHMSRRRGRSGWDDHAHYSSSNYYHPPDSISRESSYGHMPSFEVSFEDWLTEAGVTPSRYSFRSDRDVQWHHRPEGYLYRKKRRKRRKRKR